MASAELKQIREALTKESIREHQLSKVGGTETDMFICSKCHGKNCTYTQVQEPAGRGCRLPSVAFRMGRSVLELVLVCLFHRSRPAVPMSP